MSNPGLSDLIAVFWEARYSRYTPNCFLEFLNPCATTLADFGIRETGKVAVRCLVKDGTPVDAVVAAIEQNRPSVLVVGVKRTSGTPGPHGTAFSLLARSRVPVICVPPDEVEKAEITESQEAVVGS